MSNDMSRLCDDFNSLYCRNAKIDEFKGYFYDCYDEIVKFLDVNSDVFTYKGVKFGNSLFFTLLEELRAFEFLEGEWKKS